MPTYNHTRGDSHLSPCPICRLAEQLIGVFETLGVRQAGNFQDGRRWSITDLATDVAPLLLEKLAQGQVEKQDMIENVLLILRDGDGSTKAAIDLIAYIKSHEPRG